MLFLADGITLHGRRVEGLVRAEGDERGGGRVGEVAGGGGKIIEIQRELLSIENVKYCAPPSRGRGARGWERVGRGEGGGGN